MGIRKGIFVLVALAGSAAWAGDAPPLYPTSLPATAAADVHAERRQALLEATRTALMEGSFPGGAWTGGPGDAERFFKLAEVAMVVRDPRGGANPFCEWPRFKEVATFLANLHTGVDPRYGSRQLAPAGPGARPGNVVAQLHELARAYRGVDDRFAEQLARFPEGGEGAMELSSREFLGFGAVLRGNAYDERRESFSTIKAGEAHAAGQGLSVEFWSMGVPLVIEYACGGAPALESSAIHNRPDLNDRRPLAASRRRAFATSAVADVFVAEERATQASEVGVAPHEATRPAEAQRQRALSGPWVARRYVMLVKHARGRSDLADYLVIRDEVDSPEPAKWNLHVLGRGIGESRATTRAATRPTTLATTLPGGDAGMSVYEFPGQLDVDLAAHVVWPVEADGGERRVWGWRGNDAKARWTAMGEEYERRFFGAVLPVEMERGSWGKEAGRDGEMGQWLRLAGRAGHGEWMVVLLPRLRGQAAASVERIDETSARVRLGRECETIHLGTGGKYQAAVEREGRLTILLNAGEVKAATP